MRHTAPRENSLPRHTHSLLRPGALAKLEKTLQSRQIIAHYARTNLADVSADFQGIPQIGMYRCEVSDLVHFYPLVVGKASLYEQLQRHSWYYMEQKGEYKVACEYVQPDDYALEIGCGQGHFAAFLPSVNYTGLEYNNQAVAACRNKGLNVRATALKYFARRNKDRFDVVCAFQVLEHVPDPRSFIASCVYCLKPGGRLILSVPAEDSFIGLVPNCCTNLPPHHITRWSDKALLAIREEFNLSELRLLSLPLENFHHNFYCDSIAGYEACRKIGLDHTLVDIEILDKVCEWKTTLLPDVKKRFGENFRDIRGHDVLVIGVK